MERRKQERSQLKLYSLRNIAMIAVGFFLISTFLTAFVIIPKIDQLLDSQREKDAQVDIQLEAELFSRFMESYKSTLEDFAKFPSLTNAVMLSEATNPTLLDLFDNTVLNGEKSSLVLQDIDENVLIQTTNNMKGEYAKGEPWIIEILNGSRPYSFRLLEQNGEFFTFGISVPVSYEEYIEGILSTEITVSLSDVFVSQFYDRHVAFQLLQGLNKVSTNATHIEFAREVSLYIEELDLTFIYITDDAPTRKSARSLRNMILLVLLVGLSVSFVLFTFWAYRGLIIGDKLNEINRSIWYAYAIPALVSMIGGAASIASFLIILNLQQSSLEAQLVADNKAQVLAVKDKMKGHLEILDATRALFFASSMVERKEFNAFITPLLLNHPNVHAVEWVPIVNHDRRKEYEERARLDGLEYFDFREINDKGNLEIAAVRDRYFPVYYVEPMAGNERTLGFDLGSDMPRLNALKQSQESGRKVATARITMIEDAKKQTGFMVIYPVAQNGMTSESNVSHQMAERGYVVIVLKAGDIVDEVVTDLGKASSLFIQDITDPGNPDLIFGTVETSNKLFRRETIDVAGRSWQITSSLTVSESPFFWVPWLVLASGLILTVLVTFGLVNLIRRKEIVESLVKQRTSDLRILTSTVANSNDIFIITEADELRRENGGPKIVYVNEAFTRLTGYSEEDAIGGTPRILQGPKTDRAELNKISAMLKEGKTFQGELVNYTKENEEFWIEINISPLKDDKGNITHYAAVERDITERKSAQVERENLINKLTDSNEELQRFAYMCSHDLQEPMRMINRFSEKLQSHLGDSVKGDEQASKYLSFVIDGAKRAQVLISDILTYSSIENNTDKLQDVNCEELLNVINDNMQGTMENTGGLITSEQLPVVRGNKAQLFQLLQNLINNGMKYRRPGIPPIVRVKAENLEEFWKFSVRDNGIGLEESHLTKVFDVFQRFHRKNKYAGTGIGLAICKKVVQRHGGNIWVESEEGKGSTFYFTILKPSSVENE